MARKRRSGSSTRRARVVTTPKFDAITQGVMSAPTRPIRDTTPLKYSDRRFFTPTPYAIRNTASQIPRQTTFVGTYQAPQWDAPKKLPICIRRKQRRQVIHALRLTRKGRGARRRYNHWSLIKC